MKNEDIKQFYDQTLANSYSNDYEYKRWFSTGARKAGYDSTKDTIQKITRSHLPRFENYLELGPGPGTWSQLFARPNLKMDFVDISKEMLKMLEERFKENQNNRFFCVDFLEFSPDKKYDLFFSSRAIEYFDNKEKLAQKIDSVLDSGGVGVIITKMPHYGRSRFFGRKLTDIHQLQIQPKSLKNLLEKKGLKVIKIYGTTYVFPILKNGFLDRILYKIFSVLGFNFLTRIFAESYAVVFTKP